MHPERGDDGGDKFGCAMGCTEDLKVCCNELINNIKRLNDGHQRYATNDETGGRGDTMMYLVLPHLVPQERHRIRLTTQSTIKH